MRNLNNCDIIVAQALPLSSFFTRQDNNPIGEMALLNKPQAALFLTDLQHHAVVH